MSLGNDSERDFLPYLPTERKYLMGDLSDKLVLVLFGIFFFLLTLLLLL